MDLCNLRCLPLTVTLHLSSFCNQIARVWIIVSSKIWLCATLNIPISAFPPPTSNIYATQLSLLHSYRSLLFTCRLWLWLMDRLQEGWFFRSNKQKEAICILASCSRRTCRRLHHSTLSLSLKTARTVVDKMCFYVGWEADMYIIQKADLHIIQLAIGFKPRIGYQFLWWLWWSSDQNLSNTLVFDHTLGHY